MIHPVGIECGALPEGSGRENEEAEGRLSSAPTIK